MSTSLRDFAKKNQRHRGPQCGTCRLPEELLKEIRTEAKAGTSYAVMADWLRTKGHQVGGFSIGRHFREHERTR